MENFVVWADNYTKTSVWSPKRIVMNLVANCDTICRELRELGICGNLKLEHYDTFDKPIFAGKPSTFPSLNGITRLATIERNGKSTLLFHIRMQSSAIFSIPWSISMSDPPPWSKGIHRAMENRALKGSCQTCPSCCLFHLGNDNNSGCTVEDNLLVNSDSSGPELQFRSISKQLLQTSR